MNLSGFSPNGLQKNQFSLEIFININQYLVDELGLNLPKLLQLCSN